MDICQAVGGILQVIPENPRQITGLGIRSAKSQIVVLVSDPDRPVGREPLNLLIRKKCICPGSFEILGEHLLVVVPVLILQPVQRMVQIVLKIRAVPVHGKIKV